jgi:hypothetical protein
MGGGGHGGWRVEEEEKRRELGFPPIAPLFTPRSGHSVESQRNRAMRRPAGCSPVKPGSAPGHLVQGPVFTGPIPEPYTGKDSGVALVFAGPCARQAGTRAGVRRAYTESLYWKGFWCSPSARRASRRIGRCR